ncbi:hypothetical protein EDB92DRAFT_850312 [Lactarius akahatsu]|uniref:Uncharacterized protein n=1 Tax=Lactarius akahatsu TaxID=416441 RepID=A0AAD4QCN7_9AGAM|nr:hypothetical protein EDB92DRAFT_850312 [Lactarius akahatsu]
MSQYPPPPPDSTFGFTNAPHATPTGTAEPNTTHPHSGVGAVPPTHYPGCVPPWGVPGLYTSSQEQCYAAPYMNQHSLHYEGASAMVQYGRKETSVPNLTVPASSTYPQDDTTWVGRNSYGASLAADLQPNRTRAVGRGPILGETNAHSGANTNGQSHAPTTENSRSSEFLRSLARHYILDPRTNVGAIHMEPSGNGLVEMIITINVADTV